MSIKYLLGPVNFKGIFNLFFLEKKDKIKEIILSCILG